jgi:hypothetical protein
MKFKFFRETIQQIRDAIQRRQLQESLQEMKLNRYRRKHPPSAEKKTPNEQNPEI